MPSDKDAVLMALKIIAEAPHETLALCQSELVQVNLVIAKSFQICINSSLADKSAEELSSQSDSPHDSGMMLAHESKEASENCFLYMESLAFLLENSFSRTDRGRRSWSEFRRLASMASPLFLRIVQKGILRGLRTNRLKSQSGKS